MADLYLGTINKPPGVNTLNDVKIAANITLPWTVSTGEDIWHKFQVDDTVLYISSWVIGSNTWDYFKSNGIVNGKDITVNGVPYITRFLTGGISATDKNNEWDRLIVKFLSKDNDMNSRTRSSYCKEVVNGNAVARGEGNNLSKFSTVSTTNNQAAYWKIVLEEPNKYPFTNIGNENIGSITHGFIKNYIITDRNQDKIKVTEKLDGTILRTLIDQNTGTSLVLDLNTNWNNISYGLHTIEIILDDGKVTSTVTITFDKIKNPIPKLDIDANLKDAIAFNLLIKEEIEYQNARLLDNLKQKGITVSSSDINNTSVLINKIKDIEQPIIFKEGRDYYVDLSINPLRTHNNIGEQDSRTTYKIYTFMNKGTVTFSFELKGWSNTVYAQGTLRLYDSNYNLKSSSKKFSKQSSESGFLLCEHSFDVEIGDSVIYDSTGSEGGLHRNMRFYYNK